VQFANFIQAPAHGTSLLKSYYVCWLRSGINYESDGVVFDLGAPQEHSLCTFHLGGQRFGFFCSTKSILDSVLFSWNPLLLAACFYVLLTRVRIIKLNSLWISFMAARHCYAMSW